MKEKLTPFTVACHNIHHHSVRSASLALIAGISSFSLYAAQIAISSLSNGLSSLKNRLGADLLVVPSGSQQTEESILLSGTPGSFYMDNSIQEKINALNGIDQITSQFYFTSIQADCCSSAVQLVGYDPDTDFVLAPWITAETTDQLKNGDVLIGSDISASSGKIMFFGRVYTVAARMDRTASGIDQSVYMNMDTMKQLIQDAANQGLSFQTIQADSQLSAILIRLKPDIDPGAEAALIKNAIPDIDVIVSDEMTEHLTASFSSLISVFHAMEAGILIIILFVLTIFFGITFHERQKEFAILRISGTSAHTVSIIAFTEGILLSMAGALTGIVASVLIVFPFSRYIGTKLNLPYLDAGIPSDLITALIVFLITVFIGSISASFSVQKLQKAEDYFLMRKGV